MGSVAGEVPTGGGPDPFAEYVTARCYSSPAISSTRHIERAKPPAIKKSSWNLIMLSGRNRTRSLAGLRQREIAKGEGARLGGEERGILIDLGMEEERDVDMCLDSTGRGSSKCGCFGGGPVEARAKRVKVEGGAPIQVFLDLHNWLFQLIDEPRLSPPPPRWRWSPGTWCSCSPFKREAEEEGHFGKGRKARVGPISAKISPRLANLAGNPETYWALPDP